ncbi:MAG: RnfABCDGE type electron transport complex subunit D [Ruminococcus sp.]|nr:RnfABCDGE type electron transport complex subunit D [Ruminococcus sp.]
MDPKEFTVDPSPHLRDSCTTSRIMLHVIIATVPAMVTSAIFFGWRVLTLIAFCALSAMLWERLIRFVMKRPDTTDDLSAMVTGILLAFNLPVTLPIWMAAIGTFTAIVVVKQLFGGLGQNFANPAIVGRIVLMLSFTGYMTHWVLPEGVDAVSTATPLVTEESYSYIDLFLGRCGGCIGETSKLALLIGGAYLVITRVITLHAPLAFIGTVYLFSAAVGKDPIYQILSGGLMLGAIFMATDYVTTPVTKKGRVVFGIGCGIVTCVIRFWCNAPEGVSYSILLMNIVTPYIDMFTGKKAFGGKYGRDKKEAGK